MSHVSDIRDTASVRIADLEPGVLPRPRSWINAIVTLIWPYSSSTRATSLLLAEPDFRLRRSKGQVRINFIGSSARQVATSGVGIGDRVELSLGGSGWLENNAQASTPGRSVDGELVFGSRVALAAERDGQPLFEIDLNETTSPGLAPPSLSPSDGFLPSAQPLNVAKTRQQDNVWSSPVVIRSSGSEGTLVHYNTEPFADEDGYIPGRGRKRTLFARRSGEWRYSHDEALHEPVDYQGGTSASQSSSDARGHSASSTGSQPNETRRSKRSLAVSLGPPTSNAITQGLDLCFNGTTPPSSNTPELNDGGHRSKVLAGEPSPSGPVVSIDAVTTQTSDASPAASSLPKTPQSPRLQPLEGHSLPLVSPLETRAATVDLGHDTDSSFEAARQSWLDGATSSRESTEPDDIPYIPDFGNDGAIFSRPTTEQAAMEESLPVGDTDQGNEREPLQSRTIDTGNVRPSDAVVKCSSHQDVLQIHEPDTALTEKAQPAKTRRHIGLEEEREDGTNGYDIANTSVDLQNPANDSPAADLFDQFIAHSPIQPASLIFDELLQPAMMSPDMTAAQVSSLPEKELEQIAEDRELLGQTITQTEPRAQLSEHTPPQSQSQDETLLSRSRGVDELSDYPLPPTPARTRSNLDDMLTNLDEAQQHLDVSRASYGKQVQKSVPNKLALLKKTRASTTLEAQDMPHEGAPDVDVSESRALADKRMTERRKSATAHHLNEVPDVISPWFGLRRSSRRRRLSKKAAEMERAPLTHEPPAAGADQIVPATPSIAAQPSTEIDIRGHLPEENGRSMLTGDDHEAHLSLPLHTSVAIYQPLFKLDRYLGFSDSQGSALVDIFAVVADATSKPVRAKSGPRDHHVVVKVTDPSVYPRLVQVQCFRPFAKSLPSAAIGDIIVLRDFAVKTRKHTCFLLSAGSSAWHVWRYGAPQPELAPADIVQETHGPPVELGEQEQKHATTLRKWWMNAAGKSKLEQTSKL